MSHPLGSALLLGWLGLAACSSPQQNIDPHAALRLDRGAGVIVGSTTARSVDHYHRRARFFFRRVGGGTTGRLDSAVPNVVFSMLESAPDPGLDEENGRLFACTLPAGVYEIYEVWLLGSAAIVLRPSRAPRFTVRSGEVSYLGCLDVAFMVAPVSSVRGAIRGGTPSFRDEAARDVPLLRARFPTLAQHTIVPRVVDAAGVSWARD